MEKLSQLRLPDHHVILLGLGESLVKCWKVALEDCRCVCL